MSRYFKKLVLGTTFAIPENITQIIGFSKQCGDGFIQDSNNDCHDIVWV